MTVSEQKRMFRFLKHRLAGRGFSDTDLYLSVREGIEIGESLGITEERQVLRFIELQFRFSRDQLASPLIRNVLFQTLANDDWDAEQRIDYIEQQLIGRAVPARGDRS